MTKFSNETLHRSVMEEVMLCLAKSQKFILKGGSALVFFFGVDRFSEDLDYDSLSSAQEVAERYFFEPLETLCEEKGYECNVSKNTDTVSRVMIHYNKNKSADVLKVEVSYRHIGQHIEGVSYKQQNNGVLTFTLDELALSKGSTYTERLKKRDLYDLEYIICYCYDDLKAETKRQLYRCLEYQTLDDFIYRIESNETDYLIDEKILEERLFKMCETLGLRLCSENDEKKIIKWLKENQDKYPDEERLEYAAVDALGMDLATVIKVRESLQ